MSRIAPGDHPVTRPAADLRLSGLAATLADRFGRMESARPDPGRRNAAVAFVLRPPGGGSARVVTRPGGGAGEVAAAEAADAADALVRKCDLLVIRRADSRRDPWSGQMALPGGRLDRADAGLLAAAVREAREETGVNLATGGIPLGRIDAMRPQGIRVPAISIWPFAFQVGADTVARVTSREVASVHWFGVEALLDHANRGTYQWKYGGYVRHFPCIRLEGRVIWGLTYRIVTRVLEMVPRR